MSNIDLKAIKELSGLNFYIPNYQRGYKWTRQQVTDLLEDIKEFMESNRTNIYCIQPLVVMRNRHKDSALLLDNIHQAESLDKVLELIKESDKWDVVDGQQRLTTIHIILGYLQTSTRLYNIEYETRDKSSQFLNKDIVNYQHGQDVDNIDFFHMGEAYCVVQQWFANKNAGFKDLFLHILLERVKFIWYEVDGKNAKETFQRLNLGKISLTNSELIKAIFLKRKYDGAEDDISKLQISTEWDIIENALQNDEFWAFINTLDYKSPTRIDYIFEIIHQRNEFNLENVKEFGDDEYATFRYFYSFLKNGNAKEAWQSVYKIYEIFHEWYNSSKLYHYIGYIVATTSQKSSAVVSNLIEKWIDTESNKDKFIKEHLIKKSICKIIKDVKDLSLVYDSDGGPEKSKCRPLLLLHNIETIVRQNKNQESSRKFGNVFYRFPFNLYKGCREQSGWDVEHIDSNTENELRNQNDRKEYLQYAYLGTTDEEIRGKITELLESDKVISDEDFDALRKALNSNDNTLDSEEKNQIWNFALLDSKTNRGYGNSPFSAKRRVIISKEQGVTFIPPCTRNAFLKYYSTSQATNLTAWLKEDAEAYRKNMEEVLAVFLNSR